MKEILHGRLKIKIMKSIKFKRGDIVILYFPGEHPNKPYKYKISAISPDNHLSNDRVDICMVDDIVSFKANRGIGMPIKYLRKVN